MHELETIARTVVLDGVSLSFCSWAAMNQWTMNQWTDQCSDRHSALILMHCGVWSQLLLSVMLVKALIGPVYDPDIQLN